MSEKILTEELIIQTARDRGYKLTHEENMTYDEMLEKVCEFYDTEITDDWEDNLDFYIYPESTADGYEVFIATCNPSKPSINEDVYYYDYDLSDILENALTESGRIYVDDLEACYVFNAAENAYDNLLDKVIQEIENELLDKGYEWEE